MEEVQEEDVVEVDAFYARVLKRQAINNQYKRERMIKEDPQVKILGKDFLQFES